MRMVQGTDVREQIDAFLTKINAIRRIGGELKDLDLLFGYLLLRTLPATPAAEMLKSSIRTRVGKDAHGQPLPLTLSYVAKSLVKDAQLLAATTNRLTAADGADVHTTLALTPSAMTACYCEYHRTINTADCNAKDQHESGGGQRHVGNAVTSTMPAPAPAVDLQPSVRQFVLSVTPPPEPVTDPDIRPWSDLNWPYIPQERRDRPFLLDSGLADVR
jgi:hypothetical protein